MVGMVTLRKEKWRIVGIYVNEDLEEKLRSIEGWVEDRNGGIKTLISGDFNARTGSEGRSVEIEEEVGDSREMRSRKSKDGMINREGRLLVDWIEKRGWYIINGNIKGDEESIRI